MIEGFTLEFPELYSKYFHSPLMRSYGISSWGKRLVPSLRRFRSDRFGASGNAYPFQPFKGWSPASVRPRHFDELPTGLPSAMRHVDEPLGLSSSALRHGDELMPSRSLPKGSGRRLMPSRSGQGLDWFPTSPGHYAPGQRLFPITQETSGFEIFGDSDMVLSRSLNGR